MRRKVLFLGLFYIFIITGIKARGIENDSINIPSIENSKSKVLIVTDEAINLKAPSTIEAIELYNLLGHFKTTVTILGMNQYRAHELNNHEVTFYLGSNSKAQPSRIFINDILHAKETVVWINGGIFSNDKFNKKFGFLVPVMDSTGSYKKVQCGIKSFTREPGNLYHVQISNPRKVKVIATAYSELLGKEMPYIVKSGNFYYIADMPLIHVNQSDRYLLFADLLHDFIGEDHPESHNAIVRIEDVTPLRDPQNLHNIADILFERHIPFLVGIVPFFVNPAEKQYVSLSDRPELVKALKYCVEKGATIVLHGVTHQYKGESCIDFEFWDGTNVKPISSEDPGNTAIKIENGIKECIKNGIYPLIWETPHYAASI